MAAGVRQLRSRARRLLPVSCALGLSIGVLLLSAGAFGRAQPEPQQAGESEESHGSGEHGSGEHQFNWFYGFLGEQDGAEPSFLYRPKGMPPPFGATLLNSAVVYWLLVRFGRKPLADGLRARKSRILRGMDEAAKMKGEAERRLAEYEAKLARVDDEIERVREEMRKAGELEQRRILSEARDKRARMERDAHVLIAQELKATRAALVRETAHSAVLSAERALADKLGDADQLRLAERYLTGLAKSASALRGRL